jgi:predicted Zn-dependent protease
MIGKAEAKALCDRLLSLSKADQTEILFYSNDTRLTRFANSDIHQNVSESDTEIRIRTVLGQMVGVAATNQFNEEALIRTMERALEITRLQPDNPDFVSLPKPEPIPETHAYYAQTAACSANDRARMAGLICQRARDNQLIASGAFQTSERELIVANSLGIFAHSVSTNAEINAVLMSDDSSGYADYLTANVDEIDAEAIAREAVQKALDSRRPTDIDPGAYTVLLEEYAVNDLLGMLSFPGFGCQSYLDGSGMMSGRLGEKITGQNISIWDDGLDPSGLPMPFDFEGVPKRKVSLIQDGIARGVVYDSYYANKAQVPSTGHALPAPNPDGGIPLNMFIAPGNSDKAEMLSKIKRGLWITRFHYLNHVIPKNSVITGMTRDGTFLIEDGRIVRPVKNLRFTENVLEAFNRVELISKQTKVEPSLFGGNRVPAMLIRDFNFSGKTNF